VGRRAVVAAGDCVRAKLRCAPFFAHIHRPYSRRYRVGCKIVAAGDYVRSKLRCAPFIAHIHRPYSRRYRVGCKIAPTALSTPFVITPSSSPFIFNPQTINRIQHSPALARLSSEAQSLSGLKYRML
jgi:hypothetical protein